MHLAWIKKSLVGSGKYFNAGNIYYTQGKNVKSTKESLKSRGLDKSIEFFSIDSTFDRFIAGDKQTLMLIRTGGIGDLLALSSLRNVAQNHMIFITQDMYRPVFDWWENPPQSIIDITGPLFQNVNLNKWIQLKKTIKRFICEGIIENGNSQNWYEIFYSSIGAEINASLCRPKMIKGRPYNDPSNISKDIPSIVVCPRATANMRSTSFEPIYKAVKRIIGDKQVNIYLHLNNVTKSDLEFIHRVNDERIKLIKAKDIKQFLLDLFDCDMVISVDSAPVHFREGIEKPVIGIYSSFTTGARTKHYKFTHSFDIESPCKFQPCFMHQSMVGEVCREASQGSLEAPCLSEKYNPLLVDQLAENMKDYLLKAF